MNFKWILTYACSFSMRLFLFDLWVLVVLASQWLEPGDSVNVLASNEQQWLHRQRQWQDLGKAEWASLSSDCPAQPGQDTILKLTDFQILQKSNQKNLSFYRDHMIGPSFYKYQDSQKESSLLVSKEREKMFIHTHKFILAYNLSKLTAILGRGCRSPVRGEICPYRHCRWQCIFLPAV